MILALARIDVSLYRFLANEDSVLEWLQVLGYVTALVAALAIARRLWAARERRAALLYAMLAGAVLFVAGEEISWGQRIFGFGTPEELEGVNRQGETNIHNFSLLQTGFNVVLLCVGFYGSVVAWLIRRGRDHSSETVKLFIPPLFLTSPFFILFGYKTLRFLIFRAPDFDIVQYGEWAETCLAFGLAAFGVLTIRRLRSGTS